MSYTVFGDIRSGAFAAEAALAEAGANYELHLVSLEKNEQKSPEFLALNPAGKMPALRLPDGGIITESAAIMLTIADRFPQAGLIPPHATFARAEAYRWIAFMASEIYPMVEIEDYPARFVPEGPEAQALKARAVERIRERMLIVEKAVVGPWLLAHEFSAADIYITMFSRWSAVKTWREKHLPRICAIADALSKRPRIAPVWQRYFWNG
jgi:GST-like protein